MSSRYRSLKATAAARRAARVGPPAAALHARRDQGGPENITVGPGRFMHGARRGRRADSDNLVTVRASTATRALGLAW